MAVEHAPPGKRGFYGSWPQIGVPAGLLLSTIVVFPVFAGCRRRRSSPGAGACRSSSASCSSSSAWSSGCAFSRRRRSSALKETRQRSDASRLSRCCARYPKEVLLAMGARFAENGAFYIYTVFVARLRHAARAHGSQHRALGAHRSPRPSSWRRSRSTVRCRIGSAAGPSICSARCARRCSPIRSSGCSTPGRRRSSGSALIPGLHFGPRRDVRAAGRVLLGAVRHERALQRRVARRAAVVGAGGRAVADHRHGCCSYGYGRGALSLYLIGMAAVTIVSVILATETHASRHRQPNESDEAAERDLELAMTR